MQLTCFHWIPFNQPSSLLFIFTSLLPLAKNLGCLPTLCLLSDSTTATITVEHWQAELWTVKWVTDSSRQVRSKRETADLMILTVAAKEIQTRTSSHYKLLKKLLCPSCSNGSSGTLQLYAETLEQQYYIPRKSPNITQCSRQDIRRLALTHHACVSTSKRV